MDKRQNSPPPSRSFSDDRRQWERIFKTLVEMLQSQQSDMETLADERKILERYIHQQHDYWTSMVLDLESYIAQLEKGEAKGRKIHEAKLDLLLEVNQREVLSYKKQYELSEADIGTFRACVEALNAEILEIKEKVKTGVAGGSRGGTGDPSNSEDPKKAELTSALKGKLRKLKNSYKSLSSQKKVVVSALLAEKDFVWNQLKQMENGYIAALQTKKAEVEHASEALSKLQEKIQDLQASLNEKDGMITELKSRHELDMRRHDEEINGKIKQLQLDKDELCSLSKEKDKTITELRSELAMFEMDVHQHINGKSNISKQISADASMTPSRSNPRQASRKHKSDSKKQDAQQKHKGVYDGFSGTRASAPVQGLVRCSNKRRPRSNSSLEIPTLFHSNFKVPKLKNSPLE